MMTTDPAAVAVEVRTFTLGPFGTNCYLVRPHGYRGCWVVDASFSPGAMIEGIRAMTGAVGEGGAGSPVRPEAIVLTHAHIDHIAGVDEVRRAFPETPVWIHRDERHWLSDPAANLSMLHGTPVTCHGPDRVLEDGEELSLGPSRWRVLHTPGHSPGSITLLALNGTRGLALVGDALFAGSIGRTDFPGCSFEMLERSIRTRLYTLDPGTMVLPGHGPKTTVGAEMRSNPYVRMASGG
ncbi:MAG: MBL fold metallo-hydrolase [Phycisphaerales bacterium]